MSLWDLDSITLLTPNQSNNSISSCSCSINCYSFYCNHCSSTSYWIESNTLFPASRYLFQGWHSWHLFIIFPDDITLEALVKGLRMSFDDNNILANLLFYKRMNNTWQCLVNRKLTIMGLVDDVFMSIYLSIRRWLSEDHVVTSPWYQASFANESDTRAGSITGNWVLEGSVMICIWLTLVS